MNKISIVFAAPFIIQHLTVKTLFYRGNLFVGLAAMRILYTKGVLSMAHVILTAVTAVFFAIGVYTAARELWALLTRDNDDDEPP